MLGALLFKPQLVAVPALLLLLERRWRVLAGLAVTGGMLLAVSLAISPAAFAGYVELSRRLPSLMAAHDPTWKVHSWYGFFALALPGREAAVLWLSVAASILTLIAVRTVQPPWGRDTLAPWFAAALWGTVLINPHLAIRNLLKATIVCTDSTAQATSFPSSAGQRCSSICPWLMREMSSRSLSSRTICCTCRWTIGINALRAPPDPGRRWRAPALAFCNDRQRVAQLVSENREELVLAAVRLDEVLRAGASGRSMSMQLPM